MALRTPPSWLQNGSHPAENDRLTTRAIYNSTGIINSTSLAVTAQGVPNMTVNVASGWAAILSSTANAGTYVAYNDATTVLTITTADPSLPRIDRVVVTVNDAAYSGALNNVVFTVVAGTPNASPTAPATPSNSISLATIAVGAAVTSITAGNITDTRVLTTTNLPVLPITGGTLTGSLTTPGLTSTSNVAINNSTSGNVALKVSAASGQSVPLQQWANNAGTPLSWVDQNGTIVPLVGTTTVPPIDLQAGAVVTSGTIGGNVEYDGVSAYLTPNSTATNTTNGGRGVLPAVHYYTLFSSRALTSGITTAQSMFGVSLSLAASTTYEVEIAGTITFTTTSVTSCNFDLIMSSGVPSSADYWATGGLNAGSAITRLLAGSPPQGTIYTSTTGASNTINFTMKGMIRTSGAITLTPQVLASATNTSAFGIGRNTYIKVTPVGALAVNGVGAWA